MKNTTVAADELKKLCAAVLAAAGASAEDARATAHILVEADMMGIGTHGAVRVPGYAERLRSGGIHAAAAPVLDRRAPSLALVDGANALGPVVGTRALAEAIAIATETGIAYVGCRRSNHYGAVAPYAREACEAGFVMIAGTGASITMPPWGGAELRTGNNPLCLAAPCPDGVHFILDIAMSVAARGKIRAALARGESIPEGWATDARGQPTTDPAEAIAGFLLPFGGHKGSGLAMAVDLLSAVLTGARFLTDVSSWLENPDEPQELGHFFPRGVQVRDGALPANRARHTPRRSRRARAPARRARACVPNPGAARRGVDSRVAARRAARAGRPAAEDLEDEADARRPRAHRAAASNSFALQHRNLYLLEARCQ